MSKCYASKVIAVAQAELGYHEKATNANLDEKTTNSGSNNYTKYANDFDTKYTGFYNGKKNGFAWCDMFVDWCFVTAFGVTEALRLLCQTTGSAGAGCTYSLSYYKKKGQLYTAPAVGDQIFFGTSQSNVTHTGLVYKVDGTKVYTIEGNSDDQVAQRSYALTYAKIVGYGRPAYDAEGSTAASSAGTSSGTTQTTNAAQGLSVGSVVTFTGNTHYTSANATTGKTCKPGEAKVTAVSAGGKHPYHLIKTAGSASTVYGWVDAADIQTVASAAIVKGSKVKVASGAKTYTGGSLAAFVYQNTYTVLELSGSRAVIGQGSTATAAVNIKDLTLAG
jgi:hypothetical protein